MRPSLSLSQVGIDGRRLTPVSRALTLTHGPKDSWVVCAWVCVRPHSFKARWYLGRRLYSVMAVIRRRVHFQVCKGRMDRRTTLPA